MKVLLVHPRLSVKGGGERVAIHSIIAALDGGHEVSLVTENFDEKSFEDFFGCANLFDRITRCYYPRFKPLLGHRLLLYQRLIYHWRMIKRVAAREQFDAVISTQDIGYVPSTRAPVIQYCYFPEYFSHLQTDSPSPLWRLYYRPASSFSRNRVRHVRTLLSVSDYTAGFVKQKWNRNSVTVYPPCPVEDFSLLSANFGRENLVVSVGRIVPEKKFHVFLELSRMVPSTKFVVIGSLSQESRKYYDKLVRTAPGNFSIILSPLRKVRDILGRAIAYVHCAEGEHFGITIVEAMAAGCIPVVHDSGGPREIVTPDVGFRWRDLHLAAHQIKTLAEDDFLRRNLSAAASVRAQLYRAEVFESSVGRLLGRYQRPNV